MYFDPMAFARNFKKLRLQKGLSQRELSAQLGVSLYRIRICEQGNILGNSRLSLNTIIKIIKFFDCTIADLLKDDLT